MKIADPMVCIVRWAAAFHCSLGHKWKSLHTEPVPCAMGDILSLRPLYIDDRSNNVHPITLQAVTYPDSDCSAFRGRISEKLMNGLAPFKSYKFEFDNIVSSYPADEELHVRNRLQETVEHNSVCRILALKSCNPFPPNTRSSFRIIIAISRF